MAAIAQETGDSSQDLSRHFVKKLKDTLFTQRVNACNRFVSGRGPDHIALPSRFVNGRACSIERLCAISGAGTGKSEK